MEINEAKDDRLEKRAKRKLKKAEKLLKDGKEKRAERKIKKAEDIARDLKDSKDIQKDITDTKLSRYEDSFDVVSRKLNKKIKVKDLRFFKKLIIKGDEISPNELKSFFITVRNFITEEYNSIKDGDIPEEWVYKGFSIDITDRLKTLVFRYKEDFKDRIKLTVSKSIFGAESKEEITDELTALYISKEIEKETAENYREEKDKKKAGALPISAEKEKKVITEVGQQAVKEVEQKISYNQGFVNSAVQLLKKEGLYKGGISDLNDVDEDAIHSFFVEEYPLMTLEEKNIDDIVEKYREQTITESVMSGLKRGFQNIFVGKEPEGLVKDMMFGFNTDSEQLNKDMIEIARKARIAIESRIESEIAKGMEVGGNMWEYAYDNKGKVPFTIFSLALLKAGGKAAGGTAKKIASMSVRQVARGAVKAAGKVFSKKLAGTLGKAGLRLFSKALGTVPVVGWIAMAVIEGGFFWYKVDEQQKQIARIFILMYASGSEKFRKEFVQAGLRAPQFMLDMDAEKLGK